MSDQTDDVAFVVMGDTKAEMELCKLKCVISTAFNVLEVVLILLIVVYCVLVFGGI